MTRSPIELFWTAKNVNENRPPSISIYIYVFVSVLVLLVAKLVWDDPGTRLNTSLAPHALLSSGDSISEDNTDVNTNILR